MKKIFSNTNNKLKHIGIFVFISLLISCSDINNVNSGEEPIVEVPVGFPAIPINPDNPFNKYSIELGRKLFYDTILSNGGISCASCHKQEFAFTDGGNHVSLGFNSASTIRNSPPILNKAYFENYLWDGSFHGRNGLEEVAMRVLLLPNEFNSDIELVNKRLNEHPFYPELFRKAYGDLVTINAETAVNAIANFTRTIVSGNSRYDKFIRGNKNALNESEKRGMEIFFSSRTDCASCHSGFLFSDDKFHSTGISSHYFDRGRYLVTDNMDDRGKFKTPTLRNIEVTAPYMHDGEILTLEEVILHYNKGGKFFINKDPRIRALNLSSDELKDLIAFLKALTDEEMLNNPKYAKP